MAHLAHPGTTPLEHINPMEDLLRRTPHLPEAIFDQLDDKSLMKCKEVNRSWCNFINDNKILWVRMIQKYFCAMNYVYIDSWEKVIIKISSESWKELSMTLQKLFKDSPAYRISVYWHPLHIVAACGNVALCKHVLQKCKNENPVDVLGLTPLHYAAERGFADVYQLLMDNLEDKSLADQLTKFDPYGHWSPLHIAARKGHFQVCKLILDDVKEKNPKSAKDYGRFSEITPLSLAVCNNHLEICKLIVSYIGVKNIIDENKCGRTGHTILHEAAMSGHQKLFEFLIAVVNVKNPQNFNGDTPLHIAASEGRFAICKLILENVSNKNPSNNFGSTPLMNAKEKRWVSTFNLIREYNKIE